MLKKRIFSTLSVFLLITILFSTTAYANNTYAVVIGSVVNLRTYGEISYTNRIAQTTRGTIIKIHGTSGEFFRATVDGLAYVYISREWVRITQTTGTVTAEYARVLDLPYEAGGVEIAVAHYGDFLTVTSVYENWYGIEFGGEIAFVEQKNVEIPYFAELPTARLGNSLADIIIENAKNYIGTRYLWGGTSPAGFDCSGFMVYLLSPHGINLYRRSRDMAHNGVHVSRDMLQRGDLVFFNSGGNGPINHVGMYIGYGQFIHSSSQSGGGVRIDNLNNAHNRFVTARRVIF